MKEPLVSVLICSYNAAEFIESTIRSVLNQTHKRIEVLVLDNASTDKTVSILRDIKKKDSRLTLFDEKKNIGAYPGLNYLLDKAKGTYIAINDHDDIWHSDKLKKQIDFLDKNTKYVGSGTAIINWYEEYQKGILRTQPEEHTVAWHTSLVFRNDGYRYDTSKTVGTDFYFMQNILCKNGGKLHNLPEHYVFRRIWKGQKNLSSNWMKKMTLREISRLQIPLLDKLALLNRWLLPAPLVEWLLVNIIHRAETLDKKYIAEHSLLREFLQFIVA